MSAREAILRAGFEIIDREGFEASTVAAICKAARVSNGSFFHFFATKNALAAELFLTALRHYHSAMANALAEDSNGVEGVTALVETHLEWVVREHFAARFIFERSRAEWMAHIREAQHAENASFASAIEHWRSPRIAEGVLHDLPPGVFLAQLIGPAQIICRAWLSGREAGDPRAHKQILIDCSIRALVRANGF